MTTQWNFGHRTEFPAGTVTIAAWRPDRESGTSFAIGLVVSLGINVLALLVINWLFDSVYIQGFWSYALGALTLRIGNAVIKPILVILTLPLIIFTLGLAYFAIAVGMLALAEWVAPHFSIDGFWTYVGATIVVWFVNVVMQALLGRVTGGRSPRTRSPAAGPGVVSRRAACAGCAAGTRGRSG